MTREKHDPPHGFHHGRLGIDPFSDYEEIAETYLVKAPEFLAAGDLNRAGRSRLNVAYALEKLGRFHEALPHAEAAFALLEDSGDLAMLAEASHSMGVWLFHNTTCAPPVAEFERAIDLRLSLGIELAAAQSLHNLAFVLLTAGRFSDAESYYAEAARLLGLLSEGDDAELASTAFRQIGFVLSHQAYAAAAQPRPTDEVLRIAQTYFTHVAESGAHREPVYAYLAPAMALAQGSASDSAVLIPLGAPDGLQGTAEAWYAHALLEAENAMKSGGNTGTGRRAYLGAHLLALAENARWNVSQGRTAEGLSQIQLAIDLASARGWTGEVQRLVSVQDSMMLGNRAT